MMDEVWKEVAKATRVTYYVSNKGNAKSSRGPLKILLRPNGYPYVAIKGKKKMLSRLVAEAFIPNPEGKPFIDHIDTNPRNNCVENLRWCTQSENLLNYNTALKRCTLINGEVAHVVAARNGICHGTLNTRLKKGWSVEDACTIPNQRTKYYYEGRPAIDVAKDNGLSVTCFRHRIELGWSVKDACTVPAGLGKNARNKHLTS